AFHYLRKLTFRNVDAIVAISNEVRQSLEPRFRSVVISNGLSCIKPQLTNEKSSIQDKINIIMVGSPGQPWQGFDELIGFAESCQVTHPNFNFIIVGPSEEELGELPVNVSCLGFLDKNELEEVLETANIGIGTLSGYRKGINEVS